VVRGKLFRTVIQNRRNQNRGPFPIFHLANCYQERERSAMKVIPSWPWDSTWTAQINTEQEPQKLNRMVHFHRKMCFWAITYLILRYLNPTGAPCSWSLHKT
jgi:hypothetical protein